MRSFLVLTVVVVGAWSAAEAPAQPREKLDRGLVAVRTGYS
jgi:hypothetical protein